IEALRRLRRPSAAHLTRLDYGRERQRHLSLLSPAAAIPQFRRRQSQVVRAPWNSDRRSPVTPSARTHRGRTQNVFPSRRHLVEPETLGRETKRRCAALFL